MSWEKRRIGDIYEGLYDGPHATPPRSEKGAIFLGISNVTPDGHLNLDNIKYIAEQDLPKWTKRVTPKAGDIVFSYEATLNLYAMIPEGFWGCLGRRMALIRPDESKAIGKFLFYYFFSEEWRATVASNTIVGATVDRIPIAKFPDFSISLPPLETQRKIALVLSAYDALIENNQKQIKLLEEAAQLLYKEWFVDLRFPGYETTPVVDEVPEGWKIHNIGDISSVLRRGISPKYNETGKYTVINQKCIRQTVVDLTESRKQEKVYLQELNLQDSDTVICSTGTGTLGRVGQIFGEYPSTTFDSHVTLVRSNGKTGKQFLFQALKYNQSYFMSMGKGSTNQQELGRDTIRDVKICVPSDDIAAKFEKIAQEMHDKILKSRNMINDLTEARDRLLPKLMSGEIEV